MQRAAKGCLVGSFGTNSHDGLPCKTGFLWVLKLCVAVKAHNKSKVLRKYVQYYYYYYSLLFFLATPGGMQDLSSPTRDQTCAPCNGSMDS